MNAVVTTLLTAQPDPQRGEKLEPSYELLDALDRSLGAEVVLTVLADELEPDESGAHDFIDVVRVDAGDINPYMARWRLIREWLVEQDDVKFTWCVDGTDVVMLHDPFDEMRDGVLYIGSEPAGVDFWWLGDNHPSARPFIAEWPKCPLRNAGILGGDRLVVLAFLDDLCKRLADADGDLTDMGAVNEVAHTQWVHRIVSGDPVHTVFRAYDHANDHCWWAHK